MTPKPFYLAGEWRTSSDILTVRNKFDGGEFASVCRASRADIDEAIGIATQTAPQTRFMPAYKRSEALIHVATTIKARHEELSRQLALEAGKPIRTARAEIDRAILTFTVASEEAKRIGGELLPMDIAQPGEGRVAIVKRFAIGPISAITPFNFPMNLVAHKVAPALAAGCPVVLRPASATPLSALSLAEIIHDSGYPKGGFSVVPSSTGAAEPLITDERLKLLTFTGSPAVGWPFKNKAGRKRITLELGGNAGVIVHHDADLDFAISRIITFAFGYAGQSCISVQRVFVHSSIFQAFMDKFLPRVRALVVGDPLDEKTDVGPMIDEPSAAKVEEWVQEALAGGAKVQIGGTRKGSLMMPTVMTGVQANMKVCAQEVFAPLVTIVSYDDFKEAVKLVDDSEYGLQCGVFTRDVKLIWYAFEHIEVGGVIANDVSTYRIDHMPYGGVKQSGFGREGLKYAIEEMTEPKLLVMNMA
ncbi:MAG: aldehyde dehydrogenase family protein [Chloroflexi bacterium]|nr:aldehyde dehydrogenase family protein [Chloroflexota bacterium]